MLTPVGWHHYLVLLAIPFVQMVASAAERSVKLASHLDGGVVPTCSARFRSAPSAGFMVPPPTAFQLTFPVLARALEETSFIALLTGYIAAYWFATDYVRVPVTEVAPASGDSRLHAQENFRDRAFSST